jgi:hypothetical protein
MSGANPAYLVDVHTQITKLDDRGFAHPPIRALAFDEARGRAWIKHNIEEVGNFEAFLPQLYAAETKAAQIG